MFKKFKTPHLILIILAVSIAAVLTLVWTASSMASEPEAVAAPDGPPIIPTMLNYQGTLREDGIPYSGTGYFKFTIMDSAGGNGTSNYWAHDGSASGQPSTYITLTVTNGLFNVMLGDTSIMSMTQVINESVFANTNTHLRVWFSDSSSGFQALEPNQPFASVAYALRCNYAESYSESDPVFSASASATINSTMISQWNQAYGWGDHSLAGYDTTDDAWTFMTPLDVHVLNRNVGIDVPNPATLLHVRDNSGLAQSQLLLERGGPGDASMEFLLGPAGTSFSTGYDDADKNFKTTNMPNLTGGGGSFQGDMTTMYQAHPSGILDFNNQSRARAWLNHVQLIPFAIWTPIEFDDDFTPTGGYDQQNEFTPFPIAPTANFIATEEGYYQINARTAYEYVPMVPQPNPMGYVSIAIFVTDASGIKTMYAQGNNLQMVFFVNPPVEPPWVFLHMNNAPNVSDVVYLNQGDMVEIYTWQDIDPGGPVSLYFGTSQTYVSIHKDS